MSAILDKICTDTGIGHILKKVFPDDWDAILTCAYYLVSEGQALYRVKKWSRQALTPYGAMLVDQRVSELLVRVTPELVQGFFSVDDRLCLPHDLDIQVTKLKMLKANHTALKYELEDKIRGHFPNRIKEEQLYIDCLQADLPVLLAHPARKEQFFMTVQGVTHTERKEAGQALIAACHLLSDPSKEVELGEYRGFPMRLMFDGEKFKVTMKQHLTYTAELSDDAVGNIARINNALDKIPQSLKNHEEQMARLKGELENAKEEAEKPFPQETELAEKSARLTELNTELDNEERSRGKEPEKDGAESRNQEGRVAENSGWEDTGVGAGKKPSILSELRQYERPAAASAVAGRGKNSREVI